MSTHLLMPIHLAMVLIALLLVVAPRRLPQTGRALVQTLHDFKEAITGQDAAPDVD
jgi:Sec-independent protein translocase protein TatA